MRPIIAIKSEAQKAMLERIVTDPAELKRRGMTQDEVMAALAAHRGGRLPKRLGPKR